MGVLEADCTRHIVRMCGDGFRLGWHESNGGNISYRMTEHDIAACEEDFVSGGSWHELDEAAPALGGMHFMVTRSGGHMRSAHIDPASSLGIIELDEAGSSWRLVWGLEGGGKPTSELPTHIMAHARRFEVANGDERVIYHAHCPNIVTLSTLLAPNSRVWTRALWSCMTESVVFFPQGVGVVPWMVPGGPEIASVSRDMLVWCRAIIWTQHGIFASGQNCDDAFGLVHAVEKAAGYYLTARAANGGKDPIYTVSDEQLRQVCARYGLAPNEEFLD